ncbi:MAG: hypothetical protein GY868_09475 [Deltaproteobacteria bacterium]|nr:hypothetical protein [Deltaproteobacteria bacterium]
MKSSEELEKAWQELVGNIKNREEQLAGLRQSIREKRDELDAAERQLPELKRGLASWEAFQEVRKQLEDRTARKVGSKKELSYLRKSLDDKQRKLNLERYRVEADLKQKQLETLNRRRHQAQQTFIHRELLAEKDKQQQALEQECEAVSAKLAAAEETSRTEDKKLITLEGQLEQLQENLERLATKGSNEEVKAAEKRAATAEDLKNAEEKHLNKLKTAGFQLEAEIKQVQENKLKAETAWKRVYAQTMPILNTWRRFRDQAHSEGKLERLLAGYHSELQSGSKKPDRFWRRESASRATLLKTLENMNNTRVLLDNIRANRSEESDEIS